MHHINTLTKIDVKIDKCELPTFYWLPKLHKRPYKSRFISNSSHCSTTILSKHITSALTAVKDHVIKYSETAFSNSNVNYFWSIKNSSEVIEKLRLRNFWGSQVSSFNFSTLYTSLPHDLIKAKVLSLVNWCFNRESKTYLCTSVKAGFFSNKNMTRINVGLVWSYVKLLLSLWKTYIEKKKEIWPSPMTKPPIPTENSKTKGQHTQTPPKTSITQRLRTDLGRLVGVTSKHIWKTYMFNLMAWYINK